jgi:alanine racemase
MQPHRAWAEIDLDALTHNLAIIRQRAGPGTRILLVVKADAYGHGADLIAHHALRAGIGALGVGTSEEALQLRAMGIDLPILVLGTVIETELAACLRMRIHIGLHTLDRCLQLEQLAGRLGVRAQVHLNVDTGMGRLGVPCHRARTLLDALDKARNVDLVGLMTHVIDPAGWSPRTKEQMKGLKAVQAEVTRRGPWQGWVHAFNSATLFTAPHLVGNTVRVGIAALGAASLEWAGQQNLQPVLSLHSQVVMLKDIPVGASVGYGPDFIARRPTRVATIPMGYADGIPFALAGRGEALLRGQRAAFIGRVSMDYVTLDVTEIKGVLVGDAVTLIGTDGEEKITLDQVARRAGTIPYDISCSIGPRVIRLSRERGELLVPAQTAESSDATTRKLVDLTQQTPARTSSTELPLAGDVS